MSSLYAFHDGPQNDLTFKYKVYDGANWSDDRAVANTGGLSNTPAVLTFGDGIVWLFYECDHQLFYKSFNGEIFSNEVPVPNTAGAESGVAAAVYDDLIYLFFSHPNDTVLQYKTFDGASFSADKPVPPQPAAFRLIGTPAAAVVGSFLYVVGRGAATSSPTNDDRLWFVTFDGALWETTRVANTSGISNSPALTAYDNRLYLFFNQSDAGVTPPSRRQDRRRPAVARERDALDPDGEDASATPAPETSVPPAG